MIPLQSRNRFRPALEADVLPLRYRDVHVARG